MMDAKIVHIVETEVSDFSVGGNSGVDLDSNFGQVGDREYENSVACEQPLLPVKSFIEGVDQGLESVPVAEHLKHKPRDDVREVDANIEDLQEVEEHAAKTEVVEFYEQKDVDQELIPEMMDAKAVPIVETEVPYVSIGGSSGADLSSGPRQMGDTEYGDHAAYEQLSLPVKSCVHGQENEPDYLVGKVLEHRTAVDLPEIDTEMEDVTEVLEQAVDSEAIELPKEQEVNQELISERIDAEVVPIVEKEVLDVSIGGSLDLDSGSTQAGVREYGDHAGYEQPPSPVKPLDKVVDHRPEYDPSLLVSENQEHRTTGDFHEVDSEMEDVKKVQEQAADTEAFEFPKEQEVDKKLVSEKMDAKVVRIVDVVPDVSLESSPYLDSCPCQAGDRECLAHPTNEQPPFPVNTFDEGVDHGLEYEPGSSVAAHLEHRATGDFHEVDSEMEDVKEMEEQAADTESPIEQEVDQELESEKTDAEVVPIVEKEVPDVSIRGSLDLDSGLRQAEDRSNGDNTAYEQPPFPINLIDKGLDHGQEYEPGFTVARHLKHVTTGDIHEADTDIEDVKKVQEQAAVMKVAKSPKEQDVDQELVHKKFDAKVPIVETEVPNISNGGSSVADVDSDLRQAGDREYEDNAAHEQPSLPVKSFYKGAYHVPGSPVAEHLEHRATGDFHGFDRDLENVKEIQEQVASTEVVEFPYEQEVDQEMVCKMMDAKIASIKETEVPTDFIGGSPAANLDSGSEQVRDGEIEDHAVYEQQSLPIKPFVEGVDNGLEYEAGFILDENPEHGAIGEVHEVDTNMDDVQEVQEQAANNTEAIVLSEEEEVDQDLVSRQTETNVVLVEETEILDVCTGGSPGVDMDSGPMHIGDREYGDDVPCEQPPLLVKSFFNGVDQGLEYEPGSPVTERLEHSATDDVEGVDNGLDYEASSMVDENPEVYTNMDDVQEVQEQTTNNTEAIELPEEEVDRDLVSGETETNVVPVEETEVPDVCTGGSPGIDMDSGPIYIGDREYGDDAACEQPPLLVKSFVNGVDQGLEYESGSSMNEHLEHGVTDDVHEVDTNIEDVQEMLEQAVSNEAVEPPEEQEDQELIPHSAKPQSKEEKNAKRSYFKPGSLMKDHRVIYQLSPENEGDFAVFDLVWGKVKSHPWWPGQIFHPSDSSEKAMKYYRKDCYLVAYFGDRTFAWNEASVLKPFRNHFPQAERQNNSEAFQNAVSCALEEVARRVELGLACSCSSEEAYGKIKYQIVENTGIMEESSRREGVDRSTGVDSFQPDKLTEYVRTLALFPTSGADRLELLIAKSQLLAFNRLKGCDALPEFQYHEGLEEYGADTLFGDQRMSSENEHADSVAGVDAKKGLHKRKHDLKDIVYQRRKEKSMTELMGEYYLDGEFDSHEEDDFNLTSPTAAFSGTKRKVSGFLTDDSTAQQRIKTISLAKVSRTTSSNPQQSFKVGECIRRVASQLTGSSVIIKGCTEGSNTKHSANDADEVSESPDDAMTESTSTPSKESSLDEMLSQLHLSARDPMKGYSFLVDIISFFSEFRNLAVTTQRQKMRKGSGRKRKSSVPVVGSPETFEFDDRNDSYWTDMVIQDNAEAKPARRVRKRKDEQLVSVDPEKPLRPNRRKYSRKQYHHDNHESAPEISTRDEKKLDLPTELILNFGEMNSVLPEANLNKMFRRFGPLKESETEVDMQSSRARVVFKKRSDAEVAYSSAAMFNIFGSTLVNYQLNYTPSSFRNPPLALTDAKTDAT